ncbi:hypothetical protein CTI12_AA235900 [Artemisia annua]|uniref:Uncharacterized protein n=1 Tax=Artemisia annua TaxID=35608 RepID=A0A2U1NS64_ARTAN|nr:hypothetical protein CTI12_AA235900 [Artemisia annua]
MALRYGITLNRIEARQVGGESELQQASVSSTKLISIGNKRMSTLLNNPALAKRNGESGSKLTDISRPLPKVLSRDIPKQTKNTERGNVKGHENTRVGQRIVFTRLGDSSETGLGASPTTTIVASIASTGDVSGVGVHSKVPLAQAVQAVDIASIT